MIRFLIRFAILVAAAALIAWLADQPGALTIDWMGTRIEMPVAIAAGLLVVLFAALVWSYVLLRGTWRMPDTFSHYMRARKKRRGRDSLAKGMLAVGAGDVVSARKHAQIARRVLANDPLAKLLEAQAAQMSGEQQKVLSLFDEMSKVPETKVLGLRGLFNHARQTGNLEQARSLAEEALALRPGLPWASHAMLRVHSAAKHWPGVVQTIEGLRKSGSVDDTTANKKQAVVLAAQAVEIEKSSPTEALALALRAHKLDPSLVPAALVAARIYVSSAQARKALRLVQKTWKIHPHVELARVYGHARPGASPNDRLKRVMALVAISPGGEEGAVAIAEAAIEARRLEQAKEALAPYLADRPRARICSLMAELAELEGDKGRAREWLTRAIHAPRDPQWTADGVTSDQWLAVSPVSGELGVFQWKVPIERLGSYPEPATSAEPASGMIADQTSTATEPQATQLSIPAQSDSAKPNDRTSEPAPQIPIPDDPGIEPGDAAGSSAQDSWAR